MSKSHEDRFNKKIERRLNPFANDRICKFVHCGVSYDKYMNTLKLVYKLGLMDGASREKLLQVKKRQTDIIMKASKLKGVFKAVVRENDNGPA